MSVDEPAVDENFDDGLNDITVPNEAHSAEPWAEPWAPVAEIEQSEAKRGRNKSTEVTQVIAGLRESLPELAGVMIASEEGLPIAHDFSDDDAERIAAMAAGVASLGLRVTDHAGIGSLAEVVIRGDEGYLAIYTTGDEAMLIMQGPIDSNLGLMRIEARMAFVDIRQLLRGV